MGCLPKDPLRPLTSEEQNDLESTSRARSAPVEAVMRAKILLAVASGMNYTQAAQQVGRKSNDAVSALVRRYNQEGLVALLPRHGGGFQPQYGAAEKARITHEFERQPDLEQDGTSTWSLTTLQGALRKATDGLPQVSTYTILTVLHERDITDSATVVGARQAKPYGNAKPVRLSSPIRTLKRKKYDRTGLYPG